MASAVAKALVAARQKCLSEEEAYWDPKPDFRRPVSARNEAAALSWLLDHQAVVCRGGAADLVELRSLCADYCDRLGALAPPEQQRQQQQQGEEEEGQREGQEEGASTRSEAGAGAEAEASSSGRTFEEASAEAALKRWCAEKGLKAFASPALFASGLAAATTISAAAATTTTASATAAASAHPARAPPAPAPPLRGLRADSAVGPGDVVLHVPTELLISYDTARESDLGKVLSALPLDLGDDSIALIWSCVERREPEAAHAPFWAALPERFATVLSASEPELALLEGTPLHGEAVQARKHLRDAFDASAPAFTSLLQAYPDYFKPEWFAWEAYLWAAELWYSYGIQIQVAAGDIRTCLTPYLGLMNHHPLPHVVHFSKVDTESGCLRVRAFRPCAPGRQLFLSYGPYSNAKLLLFYGFALPDNPADEVELELKMPAGPSATDRRSLLAAASTTLQHRLRAPSPGAAATARLAPPLLAAARVLAAPPEQLRKLRSLPPPELKARLTAPLRGGGGGRGGGTVGEGAVAATAAATATSAPMAEVAAEDAALDAAAARLLCAAVEMLLTPAAACASRLRAEGEAAAEAEIAAAARAAGSLQSFAGVYAAGVVRILEASLGVLRDVLGK